jgi:exopolysaccharide biosynthesis polyprenyl glycosylphosphotransferase
LLVPVRRADRVLAVLLAVSDVVTAPVALLVTFWLRDTILRDLLHYFHHDLSVYLPTLPVIVVLWIVCFGMNGLYRPRRYGGGVRRMHQIIKALLTLGVALMAASYLAKKDYSRIMMLLFIVISLPLTVILRAGAKKLAQLIAPVRIAPKILVVGTGDVARRVIRKIRQLPEPAPEIVGVLALRPDHGLEEFEEAPVVGALADVHRLVESYDADEVFFASPQLERSRMLGIISTVRKEDVHFRLVSDLFEIATSQTNLDDLSKIPIIEIGYGRPSLFQRFLKRSMDLLLSGFLVLLLLPLLVLVYLILLLTTKGSPIFKQRRVGLKGREFTLYKFRTMRPEADEYEVAPLKKGDPRVTMMGKILRKTSLDELPQLFNVLGGSMSLVGPRPEMPFIVENYARWQMHRMDAKPGMTGLWQVMGRKDLPLHENIEYDFYYIRNQSIMLDFVILLRTVLTIFKGRGAY